MYLSVLIILQKSFYDMIYYRDGDITIRGHEEILANETLF